MENTHISAEALNELGALAKREFPLRVIRFAQHTPLDAHAKTSIPAKLIHTFDGLSYLATLQQGKLPVNTLREYLEAYTKNPFAQHHRALAEELADWTYGKLGLPYDRPQREKTSHAERKVLEALTRYTDATLTAMGPLPAPEMLDKACNNTLKHLLAASHHPGQFSLNDEERDILTREALDFVLAKPHSRDEKKFNHLQKTKAKMSDDAHVTGLEDAPANTFLHYSKRVRKDAAYRSNCGGLTGENLTNAYYYMRGCGGSPQFRNIVNALFKDIADTLNASTSMDGRSK